MVIVEQSNRRAFYVLIFAVFSSFVGFASIGPILPLYVLSLGVGSIEAAALWTGIILGASPLFSGVASPFWGMMSDRYGYKFVIQRQLLAFTAALVPMIFATSIWQLLVLRIALGAAGGFMAQSMALASALAPRNRSARAIGLAQVAQILGMATGPLIGGLIGDRFGFAGAVLLAAIMNGLAALAVMLWLPETRPEPGRTRLASLSVRELFSLAGFAPMLVAVALIRLLERIFDPLMPLLVVRLEPESSNAGLLAGLIMGLGTLATAASAGLAGHLAGRFSGERLLQMQLVVGALLALPFVFATNIWQIFGLRLTLGLIVGGAMTLTFAIATQAVPAERRGAAFGLLGAAAFYGSASGMFGSGALASQSFALPFLAATGLYLLAAIAATISIRQRAKVRPTENPSPARAH